MNRSMPVAICSPEPLFREGIRKILSQERRFLDVLAAIEFDGIEPWLRQHKPDVLLYDMNSVSDQHLAVLVDIKKRWE